MISFVCGYCVGYYFYDLIRPKKCLFLTSYNRKYGFVNPHTKKFEHNRWFVFRRRLIQRKCIFGKIKKIKIEEVVTSSKCSFYFGKRIMTLSVELAATPTGEIASDIIKNIDEAVNEFFAKTKVLRKIGWCSSYNIDKRFHSVYLIELAWLNISLNRRIYEKPGVQYNFVPFSLCSCFSCKSMLECLS